MAETLDIRSILAKALRMALVFMLVFWSSLRVEYLVAFADEFEFVKVDESNHDEDALTDLVIYQQVSENAWAPVPNAQAKGDEEASIDIAKDQTAALVALAVWDDEGYPEGYEEAKKTSDVKSASFVDWAVKPASGENAECVSSDLVKGKNIFTLTPKSNGVTTVVAQTADDAKADLKVSVKVNVTGFEEATETRNIAEAEIKAIPQQTYKDAPVEPELEVSYGDDSLVLGTDYEVSYENNTGAGTGKATITGIGAYEGEKSVTFEIVVEEPGGSPASPEPSDSSSSASPTAPEVASVQITYSADSDVLRFDSTLGDGGELVPANDEFSFEGGATIEFQFGATVKMEGSDQEYTLEDAKEKFASSNLRYEWDLDQLDAAESPDSEEAPAEGEGSQEPAQAASISEDGLLTVSAKGKYKVTCIVTTGDDDAQQGEEGGSDPEGQGPGEDAGDEQGAGEGQRDQSGQDEQAGQSGGEGQAESPEGGSEVSTQATDGTLAKKTVNDSVVVNVGGVDDPQGPSHPQDALTVVADMSSLAVGADGQAGPAINRAYTVEEFQTEFDETALSEAHLYNMTASGKAAAITGRGVSLVKLLEDAFAEAGADLSAAPIESVTFENYKGVQKTLSWDFLKNEQVAPLLALDSYVHQEGDAPDAPADASLLADNARFRLLFGYSSSLPSASADADDYRWINKVQVNFPTKDSEDLSVYIAYTPVPMGQYAEFVAVPVHTINGKWDCKWEVSTKSQQTSDGKPLAWTELEGETNQTLKVLTSDESVGNWYRVTIDNNTNTIGGEKSKELIKTSDPVQLVAAQGEPRLVLSYNPPRAGDMAIFTSSLYDYDGDVSKLEYVWEWSDDGGATWNELKGEKKSTLKIQTEPVSSEGSASDGSSPTLIYIRVRAIPPTGDPMVSNAQPLTVHVGDDDSDVGGDDPEGKANVEKQPKGGEQKKQKKVTEVPLSIDYSDPTDESEPTPDVPQAALDPSGAAPEIYINEHVNEKVAEQQEAIQEYVESTTPGARWTQLNTLEPSGDDISRVLQDNPLAPLVVPFSLGVTAAGGVEKLLVFRRQIGKPFAFIETLRSKLGIW